MRVYRKLDPNKNQIPNGIILPIYKQALKLSIAQKLYEKDPDNIEQAFKIAKRVEKGENFLKDEIEETLKRSRIKIKLRNWQEKWKNYLLILSKQIKE